MDVNNIWKLFLEKIKNDLSPMLYETWFMDTKLLKIDDHSALVMVPMHIHKKHLKENYYDFISNIFTEITGTNFDFEFITEEEHNNNIDINTDLLGVPKTENFASNLNIKYTFENFVVGDSNKFAKATALAVAEKPGLMYNPLFIYSSSGLGKTHLMHAIGNYIIKNSSKKVLYVTSEQFVNDFIDLYRKNKDQNNISNIEMFKKKYRDIDVLMIDDIQYLEIAAKTQQEFFNTFNELHTNNKQIIISSDRSPDDLKQLEDRLRTRFNWGLTVDILPPEFKLRLEIIDKKIAANGISDFFEKEAKEFIASNCTSDIRKIEGAITRVSAYAAMMNYSKISLDVADEALKDFFIKSIISQNKIDNVQQIIAQSYSISIEDLKSKKRNANIAVPRQIAMYICRIVLKESLTKIALEFGGKNHTTVMHAVDKISKEILINQELEKQIQKIVTKIN
ncbi:MAG: chromosomal replication initiator protein DnaA [Bacilli bacterium]|nr:chromosomal replication initiator protein DnaA [Bacilli bacterium]